MKATETISTFPYSSLLAQDTKPEMPATTSRVLIVDDEPIIQTLLETILMRAGYLTETASNGEEGWNALCKSNFDLLITDHDMPKLTGLDLLRRLRSVSHSMPVILISGQMPWETMDLVSLLRPGIAMEKPFSVEELLNNVRRLSTKTKRMQTENGKIPHAGHPNKSMWPTMMVATW
jgi:DNA-binding NtrC family response regulator